MPNEAQTEPRGILPIQIAFALTGVGTTLFGSLLPTLSVNWRLDDRRAGFLFAAQFCGSAMGALLVGSHFFRSALRGYLLLVISALAIVFVRSEARMLLFFTFGLGLGLAMTSTSMWMGKVFPNHRGAVLSVLNAWWCFGAVISAPLAAIWVKRFLPEYFYPLLGTAIIVTLPPLLGRQRAAVNAMRGSETDRQDIEWKRVAMFALIAFLYVGSETSVGGWLMSYVHRLAGSSDFLASLATSCFWLALLCGRSISPWLLRRMEELQLLTYAVVGAFVGVVMLLLLRAPLATVFSATSTGLMLGPIFPLCMARILALMHDSPKSKWTFSVSGIGAAALPALTGEVSTRAGSLHSGLLVPAFALSLMCAMMIFDRAARPKVVTLSAKVS
jgi:fucose permease